MDAAGNDEEVSIEIERERNVRENGGSDSQTLGDQQDVQKDAKEEENAPEEHELPSDPSARIGPVHEDAAGNKEAADVVEQGAQGWLVLDMRKLRVLIPAS